MLSSSEIRIELLKLVYTHGAGPLEAVARASILEEYVIRSPQGARIGKRRTPTLGDNSEEPPTE